MGKGTIKNLEMTPGRVHLPVEPIHLAFGPIHIQTAHGKGTGDHPWIASLHATDSPITNVSLLSSNIHWASKETYHFFRVTLTKIHSIKLDHNWTKLQYFLLLSIFENANVCLSQKGEKCGEKAAWFLSSEIATDKSQYGCYISHQWNWMNSYWMFWIGRSFLEVLSEKFQWF